MESTILQDFPMGPLGRYRKQATFDWKAMKILVETEEMILYNEELIDRLKQHTIFYPTIPVSNDEEASLSNKRMGTLLGIQFDDNSRYSNSRKKIQFLKNIFLLDPATAIKYSHNTVNGMTLAAIRNLGTERHQKYIDMCMKGQILACFCLTEVGHGTNTKAMRTTATYDPHTQEFVLNTPDFEAAKCWAANLGQCSSFGLVYAILFTPDGKNHGLHLFVVHIRDPNTLMPYAGVTVGNMGLKAGLNGIDNGFMKFNNYRIPRENLLNKIADVTPDGKYILTCEDPAEVFRTSMQAISGARIGIIHVSTSTLSKAISIGLRYAAIRKQFGLPNQDEQPILEYQLTQWRLLPYLAAAYVLTIFSNHFLADFEDNLNEDLIAELHAISSAGKAVSGWLARDGIQECRETCGGHGYLKVSEIVNLRSDHDATLTYDGENNVLIQQTSNWLMKCWQAVLKNKKTFETPLNSINYLADAKNILTWKFFANDTREAMNPINLLRAYKWLVCYLAKESHEKIQNLLKHGLHPFIAKNETQIYYLRTLAIVYFEHYIMQKVYEFAENISDSSLRWPVLKLLSLYGAWSLDKHMIILYQGGYAVDGKPARLIRQGILDICAIIKRDAIGLVDAIAPHDFFMSSPLGASDGQMYKRLEEAFLTATGALTRPNWWQEITTSMNDAAKSKL